MSHIEINRTPGKAAAWRSSLATAFLMATTGWSCAPSGPSGHGHAFDWGYTGTTGPEHWGTIKPEYATCKSGRNQSPVDLTSAVAAELSPLTLDYQETALDLINNGHTLQVNHTNGSRLTMGGRTYELVQFHFHSPSEHVIDGDSHAMEAHLVHQSADGQLAVLGILLDVGEENKFLRDLWDVEATHGMRTTVEHVRINVSDLLPEDRAYFKYSGSLTTPPCTEGVHWVVFRQPSHVSVEQVAHFREVFELSSRPVQPIHSRSVMLSESAGQATATPATRSVAAAP